MAVLQELEAEPGDEFHLSAKNGDVTMTHVPQGEASTEAGADSSAESTYTEYVLDDQDRVHRRMFYQRSHAVCGYRFHRIWWTENWEPGNYPTCEACTAAETVKSTILWLPSKTPEARREPGGTPKRLSTRRETQGVTTSSTATGNRDVTTSTTNRKAGKGAVGASNRRKPGKAKKAAKEGTQRVVAKERDSAARMPRIRVVSGGVCPGLS